jgi:hypothetical protein
MELQLIIEDDSFVRQCLIKVSHGKNTTTTRGCIKTQFLSS